LQASEGRQPARNRQTDPEDWASFCDYCKRDVQGTRVVWQWIQAEHPNPGEIWKEWEIDQRVNERGMPIDRALTERAWVEAQRLAVRENDRLKELTGLDNPNSNAQLLAWLRERNIRTPALAKS
jgi:DNA polymerase